MTAAVTERRPTLGPELHNGTSDVHSRLVLLAALLGFFMITLDAVIVNVALPSIRRQFGGGITGLQWVVDGYTLLFAALLLSAGAFSDRIGARRAFGTGAAVFCIASLACGIAPNLGMLIAARFVQGAAAAVMMPSSMALIGHAFPDPVKRASAIAMWAMGGAIASTSGPMLGGLLSLASWRLIFFVNLPVCVVALVLISRIGPSPRRPTPFDWTGQLSVVVAMGGLTFATIEAGAHGLTSPIVLVAGGAALAALAIFLAAQAYGRHPMAPLDLFRSRSVVIADAVGFAFMVGYYGLPFVMSLFLQQQRDLSPFATGVAFLPMMLIGAVLTPFSARMAAHLGARMSICAGLICMMAGLAIIAALPTTSPVWVLALAMLIVGLGGPFISPPVTAVLLNSVPQHLAGTASGVFNTSRQIGGALAVAVFGALLADEASFAHGMRLSLLVASAVALAAAFASLQLHPPSKIRTAAAAQIYESS